MNSKSEASQVMTRDDIIRMACEAGLDCELKVVGSYPEWVPEARTTLAVPKLDPEFRGGSFSGLERFAALVAAHTLRSTSSEPVAWMYELSGYRSISWGKSKPDFPAAKNPRPLYLHPQPAQSTQWQPIKTAPKDGTEILMRFVGHRPYITGVKWRNGCFIQLSDYHPTAVKEATHWLQMPIF